MGLPKGHLTDVTTITHNEKATLAGNGVVPQQGAEALRILWNRLSDNEKGGNTDE